MNTPYDSPAEGPAQPAPAAPRRILVWDAPVRVFHWLAVVCFAGAWLTAESERWRLVHVSLGYTLAGLVVFRLLWGLVGTRHARFASFVRGPGAALAYLRSLLRGEPQHHAGHNPAGALAIVALLALAALVTASGWAHYAGLGGAAGEGWLEELHEGAATAMLAVVALHVAGVLVGSLAHRENLVRAMVTGFRRGVPGDATRRAWRPLGALMLATVLGFWWLQWQAPVAGAGSGGDAFATADGSRQGPHARDHRDHRERGDGRSGGDGRVGTRDRDDD